jgi:hypothetical protein
MAEYIEEWMRKHLLSAIGVVVMLIGFAAFIIGFILFFVGLYLWDVGVLLKSLIMMIVGALLCSYVHWRDLRRLNRA